MGRIYRAVEVQTRHLTKTATYDLDKGMLNVEELGSHHILPKHQDEVVGDADIVYFYSTKYLGGGRRRFVVLSNTTNERLFAQARRGFCTKLILEDFLFRTVGRPYTLPPVALRPFPICLLTKENVRASRVKKYEQNQYDKYSLIDLRSEARAQADRAAIVVMEGMETEGEGIFRNRIVYYIYQTVPGLGFNRGQVISYSQGTEMFEDFNAYYKDVLERGELLSRGKVKNPEWERKKRAYSGEGSVKVYSSKPRKREEQLFYVPFFDFDSVARLRKQHISNKNSYGEPSAFDQPDTRLVKPEPCKQCGSTTGCMCPRTCSHEYSFPSTSVLCELGIAPPKRAHVAICCHCSHHVFLSDRYVDIFKATHHMVNFDI